MAKELGAVVPDAFVQWMLGAALPSLVGLLVVPLVMYKVGGQCNTGCRGGGGGAPVCQGAGRGAVQACTLVQACLMQAANHAVMTCKHTLPGADGKDDVHLRAENAAIQSEVGRQVAGVWGPVVPVGGALACCLPLMLTALHSHCYSRACCAAGAT